jgi:hypothetical protein
LGRQGTITPIRRLAPLTVLFVPSFPSSVSRSNRTLAAARPPYSLSDTDTRPAREAARHHCRQKHQQQRSVVARPLSLCVCIALSPSLHAIRSCRLHLCSNNILHVRSDLLPSTRCVCLTCVSLCRICALSGRKDGGTDCMLLLGCWAYVCFCAMVQVL